MRIELDYSHCIASNIGVRNGVPEDILHAQDAMIASALEALRKKETSGELGFFTLFDTVDAPEILRYVEETSASFDDIVVVGIGGSSLGNRALHQALNHPLDLEGRKIPNIHIC